MLFYFQMNNMLKLLISINFSAIRCFYLIAG
jgi:hypothetical protein